MKKNTELVLGYAPTRREVFSREDALKYKNKIFNKIKSLDYRVVDIEDINEDGLLIEDKDVAPVVEKFKREKVDCIFAPHCNFGTESVVARVAKELGKPVLLWGPRDEKPLPDGTRLRDTQCGLFATSKILQRYSVPFTYIINCRLENEVFSRGFNNFISASNIVKTFKKIRIGQIGVRPEAFWTVIANEGELLEKFNIEIVPYNLSDVISLAEEIKNDRTKEIKDIIDSLKKDLIIEVRGDELAKMIALKEAIKQLKIEDNISAFAIQCWHSLQDIYDIVPCFTNGLLFDEGIPVACEADINGAITTVIAAAATFGKIPFFADLTIRNPTDDNSELLFHCGNFPPSISRDKKILGYHAIMDNGTPGTCNFEIKGGDITVLRFDELGGEYSLFTGHAKSARGPKTIGTYMWIKVKDWTKWEEKFIYGPYIHHVTGIHSNISPALYEATRYIEGLTLDPIEPGEEEIKDYLAGRVDEI